MNLCAVYVSTAFGQSSSAAINKHTVQFLEGTQTKINFLTSCIFSLYFHFSNLPAISTNEFQPKWQSRLQFLEDRIPTFINFEAYLPVSSIFTQAFDFHTLNNNPPPIIFLFCDYFCSIKIYRVSCAVVVVCHSICFLC